MSEKRIKTVAVIGAGASGWFYKLHTSRSSIDSVELPLTGIP